MFSSEIVCSTRVEVKEDKESRVGEAYKQAWKERDKLEIELNRSRVALLDEFGQLIRLNLFKEH
ncbi:hypothetical protein OAP63_01855 [Vibrio sp.]|uniref:Uncharacterized protein n=1 Tax=Vibrio viridaestus TaxID=2487322 RepID=A0A3N9TKI7_9VIBR|nr:hypothetical protein [Vibrio viridaestus]MDC0609454.1 hypothetical protein [Vibrio sp.]RQW64787.1 hypothetical protein EES38_01700 [Vibrio viridaestus]